MTQEKRVLNPTIKAESKKLSANQNLCENYIIFRKNLVKNQAKSLVRVLHNIEILRQLFQKSKILCSQNEVKDTMQNDIP